MQRTLKTFTVILSLSLLLWALPSLAQDRFTDNGDGTVTDNQTGLMWAKTDTQGDVTWKDAERYCKVGPPQIIGKYDDWRMPTIEELETIYHKEGEGYETDCGQVVKVFPAIQLSCGWVWSSEQKSITARVFNFHRGYIYTDRRVHMKHYRALPVRSMKK
jgi:hypothetical protein